MKPFVDRSPNTRALGVGVGLRKPHVRRIAAERPEVDWFEFTPENYMNRGGFHRKGLRVVAERYPVAAHGVGANLGSPRGVDREFVSQLREVCREAGARWASDHCCYTTAGGRSLNELLPLPFTGEAAKIVAANVRRFRDALDIPYLIENISYYAVIDDREMDEAAFLTAVLEEADCGLLLDVNNVYVNGRNHGFDPLDFIKRLPLHRVVQVHLAGHDATGPVVIDTHGAPVCGPVWRLFEAVAPLLPPCSILIEWDNNIPKWERLKREADAAKRVWTRGRAPRLRAAAAAGA